GRMRLPAVADTGPRAFGRRAGDNANAAVDLLDDDVQHPAPFAFVEPRHLAGDAQRRDPTHARRDEEVDHAPEARLVDVTVGVKGRGEYGVDAFELHRRTPSKGAKVPRVPKCQGAT